MEYWVGGLVNQRRQIAEFAPYQALKGRSDSADRAERIHRGRDEKLDRRVSQLRHAPKLLAGKIAGYRRAARFGRQRGVKCSGTGHVHLVESGEVQHIGAHADDRIGSDGLRMHDEPVERVMARLIEYIAEFFDLPADQRLQRSGNTADGAHSISNVAENEFPWI